MIRSQATWVRPRERVLEVAFESPSSSPVVSFWRRRPLMFLSPAHPRGVAEVPDSVNRVVLVSVRGMTDVSELIREAIEWQSLKETTGRRYRVRHIGGRDRTERSTLGAEGAPPPANKGPDVMRPGTRFLHWNEDDIGPPRPEDPFRSYALTEATVQCRKDFQWWLKLRRWYLQKGIPWRRGHLLYGPPGTGKTSLVRAIAQEADFPVFVYDLSTMTNEEFRNAWNNMQESAPCIALIEDIDGVFNGRVNVLSGREGIRSPLTFDCLLNVIGGIQSADGVFLVVTTNKPETVDEALGRPDESGNSSRPGRIDRTFYIPPISDDGRAAIIERICDTVTKEDVACTAGFTAVKVTDYAITKALNKIWSETPDALS